MNDSPKFQDAEGIKSTIALTQGRKVLRTHTG